MKKITEVDEVQTIADTDKVFVNSGGDIKQIKKSGLLDEVNSNIASKMPKSAMSNSKVITTKGESVADAYELNKANSDSYAKAVQDQFDAVNDSLPTLLKRVGWQAIVGESKDYTYTMKQAETEAGLVRWGSYLVIATDWTSAPNPTIAIATWSGYVTSYCKINTLVQGTPVVTRDGYNLKVNGACGVVVYALA